MIGVVVLCYCVAGYMVERLGIIERVLIGIAGLAILSSPLDTTVGVAANVVGAGIVAAIYWHRRRRAVRAEA